MIESFGQVVLSSALGHKLLKLRFAAAGQRRFISTNLEDSKKMPTYDYECDACGHAFEQYQGINDPKLKKCPECGKLKLRRLLGTGAAIMFKGSGFYQTDYRSESYKKSAAADKPASDSAASGDSTKSSESKASKASESSSSKSSESAKSEAGPKPKPKKKS
jgi:putative FmdB family regulatory protein